MYNNSCNYYGLWPPNVVFHGLYYENLSGFPLISDPDEAGALA